MKRAFISDCEGPISKNDNAYETTKHFVPNGDRLFTVVSAYDDALADVIRRPGHKAGNTLKYILPFLKIYCVTDQQMRQFAAENLVLIPHIKESLKHIRNVAHAYIVSTSYEHYIRTLCETVDFPFQNTYCTRVNIDKYQTTPQEEDELKNLAKEIAQMQPVQLPPKAKSLQDFSRKDQETINRLDEIFTNEIACMQIGRIYAEVVPLGGTEKAESVNDVVHRLGIKQEEVMYIGDSITDEEAFKLVKKNGGLTVSFNGNQYAVQNAEIAVVSESSVVTAIIADVFCRFGKQATLNLVKNWIPEALETSCADHILLEKLFKLHPEQLPKVKIVTPQNMQILSEESTEFRKKVRGEAIGTLG